MWCIRGSRLSWSAGVSRDAAVPSLAQAGSTAPVVGTVTRLVKVKDLDLLLDAMALLVERVPTARLVIAGDGPERPHLEGLAVERGLTGQVEFLGRVEGVQPVLAGFDAFAMTSLYEGLGISALEGMAMGVPVVATAVGGLSEVVEEGVTGFLVPRGPDRAATAAALAARVAELLLDGPLRNRMGEAARVRVAERFSPQAAGRKMLAIYRRELSGVLERGASQMAGWPAVDAIPGSPTVSARYPCSASGCTSWRWKRPPAGCWQRPCAAPAPSTRKRRLPDPGRPRLFRRLQGAPPSLCHSTPNW